jgi:hypothetical protein
MKALYVMLIVTAGLLSGCWSPAPVAQAPRPPETQPPPPTDEDAFPMLRAYGNWIDVPPYGEVWQPGVSSEWQPFFNGQWIWTDRGWLWDSDEPYGWVVYHYGYWTTFGSAGWVWVPDYEWSPARVRWYNNGEYIGWAPMPPPHALFPPAYETGSERIWVVVRAHEFTRPAIGRFRSHGIPPPPTGRPGLDRAPDVRDIEMAGNARIPQRKTDRTDVRHGKQTFSRFTPRPAEPPPPAPPVQPTPQPPPRPAPPPVVTPNPAQPPPPAQKPPTPATKPPVKEKKPARPPEPRSNDVPTPVIVKPTPDRDVPRDTVQTKKAPTQPSRRPRPERR